VVWANRTLLDLLDAEAYELAGLTAGTADPRFAALFGCEERFAVTDQGGMPRWLKRIPAVTPTTLDHWAYFVDITREVELAQEVAALEVRDSETGVLNRRGILAALDKQVARTRRYGNPLAIACLEFRAHDASEASMPAFIALVQELRAQLRWVDEVGRLDRTRVLLILPETDEASAARLLQTLQHDRIEPLQRGLDWAAAIAVTAWRKGDDQRRLLERLGWPPAATPE
jgi:GGDEF domain-containing protein